MACGNHHEAVERMLWDVMVNVLALRGKLVIIGGDLGKVLPVLRRETPAQVVDACINPPPSPRVVFCVLCVTQNGRVLGSEGDDPTLGDACTCQMRTGHGTEEEIHAGDDVVVALPDI